MTWYTALNVVLPWSLVPVYPLALVVWVVRNCRREDRSGRVQVVRDEPWALTYFRVRLRGEWVCSWSLLVLWWKVRRRTRRLERMDSEAACQADRYRRAGLLPPRVADAQRPDTSWDGAGYVD
jgi:hypothetical protein